MEWRGDSEGMFDEGGVCIDIAAVVSEGGIANTEGMVKAKGSCGVSDLMKAFDSEG